MKTMILSKYHPNMTLITDREQCQLGKNIDFSLCMVVLNAKDFVQYAKRLVIFNHTCNFLKACL